MSQIILVDDWRPTEEDKILKVVGKMVRVDFNRIIDAPIPENFKMFIVSKKSYIKWMNDHVVKKDPNGKEIIEPIMGGCDYINYFIKYYDHNNELLTSYLKIKYMIDENGKKMKLKAAKKAVYDIVMKPSLVEKIKRMTEDNWVLDLTPDPKKKYPDSLKFENEHAKILMNIGVAIKILIPIVSHYLAVSGLFDDDVNNINRFYMDLFDIFGGEVDIYNKLWITVLSKVNRSLSDDRTLWLKHEIFGEEESTYMRKLLHEFIIRDTMMKFVYNNSLIFLVSAVIEQQLVYLMKNRFQVTLINADLSTNNASNAEGLSGIDKIELNSYKLDESNSIIRELNIENNINKLRKRIKYKDFDNAVDYYMEHHVISDLHIQVINIFASSVGCRDLTVLTRIQYMKMMTIIKTMLQMRGMVYLPQILSGNITASNRRIIRNKKFINSIESSSAYENIIKERYSALLDIGKESLIMNMMSMVVSSSYSIVDYNTPEFLGKELEINPNDLLSEFLLYLSLS